MWLRQFSITAQASGGQSIDLSALRCRFQIQQHNIQGPDKCVLRITNQNPDTARQFTDTQAEYTTLSIYCGYEDDTPMGMVFSGNIVQAIYGRESPTDTLTTIVATAGAQANQYATVNKTFPAGSTPRDHLNESVNSMSKYGLQQGTIGQSVNLDSPKYPRAVTLFGMARDVLWNIGHSLHANVTYNCGQIHIMGQNDTTGSVVVLNSTTGMIGMPSQQIGGIMVRSLINPAIHINGQIQINQGDIQRQLLQTDVRGVINPAATVSTMYANIAADGIYNVYRIDLEGDTRGMPWYMDIACLTPGQLAGGGTSASIASSVNNPEDYQQQFNKAHPGEVDPVTGQTAPAAGAHSGFQ